MKNRIFVMLGRAGDVLNVLSLCWRDYVATGKRPLLMVAEPFASLLDGVGYVEPVIWRGKFEDVAGACQEAETIARTFGLELICTQIYGQGLACAESCSSFMRESWDRVPGAPAWGTLPLVFDRRSTDRETAVKGQLLARSTGKPYVLLALSGTSSPFVHAAELSRYLRDQLGSEFDFIDIGAFIAPRFFDLLGVFAEAHCLVTIDAGPLHLAHATPDLPVVAFITREPSLWHGSPWRPSHVGRFFYDEAPDCFDQVAHAVRHAKERDLRPKIWHVWSDYPTKGETARRMALAHATWATEHANGFWRECPFTENDQWRHSGDVGDVHPMPYVSDLVEHVLAHGPKETDIVAFTNADVCFAPGLTGWILEKVTRHGAAYTHRYDFARLNGPLVTESAVKRGKWYPGSDAFFFTVAWWRQHGAEYPEMILGREQCDEVLRQLVKRHGGVEIPGAIYHEKHGSLWNSSEQHAGNRGNQHNRRLARQWFVRHGYGPNDPLWWALPAKPY
jgi:hypothetical protein